MNVFRDLRESSTVRCSPMDNPIHRARSLLPLLMEIRQLISRVVNIAHSDRQNALALRAACTGLAVLVCVAAAPNVATTGIVQLNDFENYSRGPYGAYASPWSTFFDNGLVHGVDYLDTIKVIPRTFPDGTILNWHWPARVSKKTGVWGYIHVFFGNYNGGKTAVYLEPRQVRAIHILREDLSVAYEIKSDFNLLNEFYLTLRAGESASKVIEIGYFLHISPEGKQFFERAKAIGSYRDDAGQVWVVRRAGDFCMLLPPGGHWASNGSIDLKSTFAFLRARGLIKGDEWFNGLAIGVEPVRGAGRLEVQHWTVSFG